jgi:hypothetical protein
VRSTDRSSMGAAAYILGAQPSRWPGRCERAPTPQHPTAVTGDTSDTTGIAQAANRSASLVPRSAARPTMNP